MKYVGVREAYENLANAIVLSAVEDYKAALIHLKKHPDSKAAQDEVRRHEKFFYSDWYAMLTDLDPGYLIPKMKEMVNEGDSVEAGQVIGSVGQSAVCEAELGWHLHFELARAGESVDFRELSVA